MDKAGKTGPPRISAAERCGQVSEADFLEELSEECDLESRREGKNPPNYLL